MAGKREKVTEIISGMTKDMANGKAPVVSAEQVTEFLKSSLQTERIAYLQVGRLLALVRDDKLYAELNDVDDLIWIETKLGEPGLRKEARTALEALKGLPEEILPGLDQFIDLLKNAVAIPHMALEETKKARVA